MQNIPNSELPLSARSKLNMEQQALLKQTGLTGSGGQSKSIKKLPTAGALQQQQMLQLRGTIRYLLQLYSRLVTGTH